MNEKRSQLPKARNNFLGLGSFHLVSLSPNTEVMSVGGKSERRSFPHFMEAKIFVVFKSLLGS